MRLLIAAVLTGLSGTASAIQITDTRRLTAHPADQYNPVISGGFVVYTDTRSGNADVYLYNLASGAETNITNDPANQLLNDVNGDFVVYSDYRTGIPQVWTYHIPSGDSCQLTNEASPQVSPSIGGNLVVFQSMAGDDSKIGYFDLSTLDPDAFTASCNAAQITPVKTLALGAGRQFYPRTSGRWVVYQETLTQGTRVRAYDRETATIIDPPEHQKNQLLPDIDGAHLAYIEDDGASRDIVYFDLETRTFVQITHDAARQNYPSISGNYIAFEDSSNGNLDIFMYDLSTGLLTQLTNDPANQYLNSIDHEHVVFTDASAGNLDVVMVTFAPDAPSVPEPCRQQGEPTLAAAIALDDEAVIVAREHISRHRANMGGDHTEVSDRKRITYDLQVAADVPQALLTVRLQLSKSSVFALLRAAGLEQNGGIVLRVNGTERRWYDPAGGGTTIVASAAADGEVSLSEPKTFLLPPWFQVTEGRADGERLFFTYDGVSCRYRGFGKKYFYEACNNGRLPGQTISASTLKVHVTTGEVTAKIYPTEASGTDAWTDVSFTAPVPLFKGSNQVVIEGPGYGTTYLKYRDIGFADGGTLQAFAKPMCLPDTALVPECHDPATTLLYGPYTFVRHAGPTETTAVTYDAAQTGGAILCVANGSGDGSQRVTAGVITHNGNPALGPYAFGTNVVETAAAVIANPTNTLGVQLHSAPGSFITVTVIKSPTRPPLVEIPTGCNGAGGTMLLPLLALMLRRRIRAQHAPRDI